VAVALNNLAVLTGDLGRRAEARRPHRRALAILEHAYGPRHRLARTWRANVASLWRLPRGATLANLECTTSCAPTTRAAFCEAAYSARCRPPLSHPRRW
jgi:hypothetical protein